MPPAVGQTLPALELPDLSGHPRPLCEAWAGGTALIVLGHRNCKTTRQTLPYVDQIHRRRSDAGAVVAVLQDEPAAARELIEEAGLTLPVLCEPDPYPLAAALRVTIVPTLLVVDRAGRVVAVSEAFCKADLQAFALQLGAAGSLFAPDDAMPAFKPG